MAGPHLERLRAQKSQKRVVEAPSKPSKPGFEGFEGDQCRRFSENHCVVEGDDVAVKNSKNTTPAHPQNLQYPPSMPPAASLVGAKIEIVELPQAQRYRRTFAHLQLKPPALVEVERWQQCVRDGGRFLAKWGEPAQALNWSSADLFALIEIPEHPSPSFNRLSRYDRLGLIWLLQGREVIALTEATASIRNPTRSITVYHKHNKPALGPVGDSLED